jgi:hypothetical protein
VKLNEQGLGRWAEFDSKSIHAGCWSFVKYTYLPFLMRWGQPGQQQGRRIPSINSLRTRSTCSRLVSGFLTEIVQQIHSFRARGVKSFHASRTAGDERSAFLKSAGTKCTTPEEIVCAIGYLQTIPSIYSEPKEKISLNTPGGRNAQTVPTPPLSKRIKRLK